MWIFAIWGTAALRCISHAIGAGKGRAACEQRAGGRDEEGWWLCSWRQGLAMPCGCWSRTTFALPQGQRAMRTSWHLCWAWEEVPPAKEPAGCGAAPGAPGSAEKALSKNGMSSGEAVPTNLTSYMDVGLSGLDFFSVYFPLNEKNAFFFSLKLPKGQNGKSCLKAQCDDACTRDAKVQGISIMPRI